MPGSERVLKCARELWQALEESGANIYGKSEHFATFGHVDIWVFDNEMEIAADAQTIARGPLK